MLLMPRVLAALACLVGLCILAYDAGYLFQLKLPRRPLIPAFLVGEEHHTCWGPPPDDVSGDQALLQLHGNPVYKDYSAWRGPAHGCPPTPQHVNVSDMFKQCMPRPRISILVQSYRAHLSLNASLFTWKPLLDSGYVCNVVFYFNNRTTADDEVVHKAMHNLGVDYIILGNRSNVQLGFTIPLMAQHACSPVVLFLEKDWQLKVGMTGALLHTLIVSQYMLQHEGVDVVHVNKHVSLSTPHVWPCGTTLRTMSCTVSRFREWTNNPFIARTEWLHSVFDFWAAQHDPVLYRCHHKDALRYIDIEELFHRRFIPWVTANWIVASQFLPDPIFQHVDIDGHGRNYGVS
jgi:hypothetical protein